MGVLRAYIRIRTNRKYNYTRWIEAFPWNRKTGQVYFYFILKFKKDGHNYALQLSITGVAKDIDPLAAVAASLVVPTDRGALAAKLLSAYSTTTKERQK